MVDIGTSENIIGTEGGVGAKRITRRQMQCLNLVRQGKSSKEIARILGLSPSTVDNHLQAVLSKIGSQNRMEAAKMFFSLREGQGDEFLVEEISDEKPNETEPLYVRLHDEGGNPPQNGSFISSMFSLPPIGGKPVKMSVRKRYYHVVQLTLLAIFGLAGATLSIAGIVHLFSK